MKFNLLTNGVDSLKASYDCLSKLDGLEEGTEHNIKDALMYLNHANEILFKLILKNQHEYLMFADIAAYTKAKSAMKQQNKSNVFEVNNKLRTVNFATALERLEYLCDIDVPEAYKITLGYLNKMRNELMHFEIDLNLEEVETLIRNLKVCHASSIKFFENHVPGISIMMYASRFEISIHDYLDDMGSDMAERYAEDAYDEYREEVFFGLRD